MGPTSTHHFLRAPSDAFPTSMGIMPLPGILRNLAAEVAIRGAVGVGSGKMGSYEDVLLDTGLLYTYDATLTSGRDLGFSGPTALSAAAAAELGGSVA